MSLPNNFSDIIATMMDDPEFSSLIACISVEITQNLAIVPTAGKRKMQGGRIHEKVTTDVGGRGEDADTCSSGSSLDNR